MQELGKIKLQDSSGGINVDNFIRKKFSGEISFFTILAINILLSKIIKVPTAIVMKLNSPWCMILVIAVQSPWANFDSFS